MLVDIPDHLWKDVEQLITDKGALNAPDNKDIDKLVADKTPEYREYWGDTVVTKRNWQSSPDHPKTFLAYITIAEAKMLRSMGLGYSDIAGNGKYKQHHDKHGIPSFNGDTFGSSYGDTTPASQSSIDSLGSNSSGGWSFDESYAKEQRARAVADIMGSDAANDVLS